MVQPRARGILALPRDLRDLSTTQPTASPSQSQSKGCGCKWSDLTHPGSGVLLTAFGISVGHLPCPWPPVGGQGCGAWSQGVSILTLEGLDGPGFYKLGLRRHLPLFPDIPLSASPAASEGTDQHQSNGPRLCILTMPETRLQRYIVKGLFPGWSSGPRALCGLFMLTPPPTANPWQSLPSWFLALS